MRLSKCIAIFCCILTLHVVAQESGKLVNGLQYHLEHSETSKEKALLWLVVKAGMMHEGEHELGFAHLVEHLTWSGTKNLNAQQILNEIIYFGDKDKMEQIGAITGMDAAYFQLNIDLSEPQALERALFLLRELAGSALIPPEALDSEKKEVLQELQDKMREPNLTKLENQLTILLQRPINFFTRAVVEATQEATPKALQDFYHAKYRPHQMALIAVGDFDESSLKKSVEHSFGSMENLPPTPAEPQQSIFPDPQTSWMLYKHKAFKLPHISVAYLLPLGEALLPCMQHSLQQLVEEGSVLSCWSHLVVVSETYQLLEAGVVLFDTSSIVDAMDWFASFAEQPEFTPHQAMPLGNKARTQAFAKQFLHPSNDPVILKNCPKLITVAYSQD